LLHTKITLIPSSKYAGNINYYDFRKVCCLPSRFRRKLAKHFDIYFTIKKIEPANRKKALYESFLPKIEIRGILNKDLYLLFKIKDQH